MARDENLVFSCYQPCSLDLERSSRWESEINDRHAEFVSASTCLATLI
jgi:hypothetical protein